MIYRAQRNVLFVMAALGVYAFLNQPMVDLNGLRLGWHFFASTEVQGRPGFPLEPPHPDYPMLAAEYAILAFVTVCLYLAARPIKE